ncbi:hypothetical protein GU243_01035 [Pseudarthrobacter psychrotolerans]|uniref:Apea-like HEPN domain-containing protein n=1 Tax=Pseudarthrobacter psychrotolerans TaxID=2697569 RepID=A0A6P1NHE1_9MICC|nr:hypothetical protein [Pseudarthrobacter psychrotolerans]QHK18593.1 hypothetical protein GU243_01035 [Pseudarthrobacter psychrotolerans]
MTTETNIVRELLAELQRMARGTTSPDDGHAMTFRLPPDLIRPEATMLAMSQDDVDAMNRVEEALTRDLHFEHMDKATDALKDFVARAWADRKTDQVQEFVAKHSREPSELVCFLPIEYLTIDTPTKLLGLQLLPVTDPCIPTATPPWFALAPPIGSVAAIPVTGTNLGRMAERAQALLAHALRVARVGLRDHNGINGRQLRFRPGIAYVFSNNLSGWRSRSEVAYDLTLGHSGLDSTNNRPVWTMPVTPMTDIQKKADLALRWMERARFADEPLIALLYLFFALEALLGDKSEGLKADMLAFRQLVLSYIVTGVFRHPNNTWFLYDRVRSAAVHGEDPRPSTMRLWTTSSGPSVTRSTST